MVNWHSGRNRPDKLNGQDIQALLDQGMSMRAIARELNTTTATLRRHLHKAASEASPASVVPPMNGGDPGAMPEAPVVQPPEEGETPGPSLPSGELFGSGCRYIAQDHWQYGQPNPFCCQPCEDGSSWCLKHRALVYVPAEVRIRRSLAQADRRRGNG